MAIIPGRLIDAPQSQRRRYGLFDAASGPLDLPDHGEGGGVRYVPETCGQAYAYGINCYGGEVAAPGKPLDGDAEAIETGVFAVLATMNCGSVGYTTAEYEAKVRRRLELAEQPAVERALWTGLDLDGNSLGILALEDAAEVVPGDFTDTPITEVIGALERYAYTEQGYGPVAYLHAPVEVAAFAAEAGLIMPGERGTKVTPLGSIWSFGAYPSGSIIISGQTTVWRSPEVRTYQSFENASNEVLTVAERTYAVSFDCFAGVAEFDPLEGS